MSLRKNLVRVLSTLVLAIIAILAMGAIYEYVSARLDAGRYPPPGRMYTIDDSEMHLIATGPTGRGPTIVLEAGATGFSSTWAWIQADLATEFRVVSYDRAGLGWSQETSETPSARGTAERLKRLLVAANEPGPYLLVGHSMGGIFIRAFAEAYPDDVAGLVFVDSSHPDQLDRFPAEFVDRFDGFRRMLAWAPLISRTGILRLTNAIGASASGLPPQPYAQARAFGSSHRHLKNSHRELAHWEAIMDEVRPTKPRPDVPILAISAEVMPGASQEVVLENHRMHRELAALSSRGRHLVLKGTDHFSLLMKQSDAASVSKLIRSALLDAGAPGETRANQ